MCSLSALYLPFIHVLITTSFTFFTDLSHPLCKWFSFGSMVDWNINFDQRKMFLRHSVCNFLKTNVCGFGIVKCHNCQCVFAMFILANTCARRNMCMLADRYHVAKFCYNLFHCILITLSCLNMVTTISGIKKCVFFNIIFSAEKG